MFCFFCGLIFVVVVFFVCLFNMTPLIQVWLLLQCSELTKQEDSIILNWKEKECLLTSTAAIKLCCYTPATLQPTFIPMFGSLFFPWLPSINWEQVHWLQSWATLEWGCPFSTGYTTYFFPNTQSALISTVAAELLTLSVALRFLPENRNNDREGWIWISVSCLEQNKICWDGLFLLAAQWIPFILLLERCSVKTTKVI